MLAQPFPGIYLWRDPHGRHYLVDHTGTRPLRNPAGNTPSTGPPDPATADTDLLDITIDVYPADADTALHYETHHAA